MVVERVMSSSCCEGRKRGETSWVGRESSSGGMRACRGVSVRLGVVCVG